METSKAYQPEYLINALVIEGQPNKLPDGIYYAYSCPIDGVAVVFSKNICAN